jgi:transcriptional regulator with XRE-family HTH domain
VPDHGSPTVRRRRLAAELRRLRERAGFTGDEVAERLGWSASKISRIELHRTGIKHPDLLSLLDLYGIIDSHRDDLIALARESGRTGWLEAFSANFPGEYAEFLPAENEARTLWNWEPQVVPGLLQTADYARAVMVGWHEMFPVPPADVDRRVEARLLRQQVLERDPPLMISVVIDESVLYRRLGDRSVMRLQLERLAEVSELPNIKVQIKPLNGLHLIGTGPFSYMTFFQVHDVPLRDLVLVEHLAGSHSIEDEDEAYQYQRAFQKLMEESLAPAESRKLIRQVTRETWS